MGGPRFSSLTGTVKAFTNIGMYLIKPSRTSECIFSVRRLFVSYRFSHFLEAMQVFRVSRGIAILFLGPRYSRWGWGVSSTPLPPLPPGKTRYPFYRRLGGPQGRSGLAENLVLTGIRSRTVQPVVSHYND